MRIEDPDTISAHHSGNRWINPWSPIVEREPVLVLRLTGKPSKLRDDRLGKCRLRFGRQSRSKLPGESQLSPQFARARSPPCPATGRRLHGRNHGSAGGQSSHHPHPGVSAMKRSPGGRRGGSYRSDGHRSEVRHRDQGDRAHPVHRGVEWRIRRGQGCRGGLRLGAPLGPHPPPRYLPLRRRSSRATP